MTVQDDFNNFRKPRSGSAESGASAGTSGMEIPNRYLIRETGSEKWISCIEAPNVAVSVKSGLSFPAAAVGKAAPGTIFLDGVAQYGPLLDHERQVYNFDHHEGCVRMFTLATCEQVLLMLKKGLDLRSREWKIYANDPDLDTVLAIWLLLNHIRINEHASIRENILFPLVRLQGSIDALGLEMRPLLAFPPDYLNQHQRIIDRLRSREVRIKKDGLWEQTDFMEYTADILCEIDRIVYESKKMGELLGIVELARVNLPDNRVAVVLQSDLGIYEIEPQLKKIYGGNIGLAVLRKSESVYTVRQVDPFLKGKLEDVYEKLNFMDPAVRYRNLNNKWGGSTDIGGSPRETGTLLTPEEIACAVRETYQRYSPLQRLIHFACAAVLCLGIFSLADLAAAYWNPVQWFGRPGMNAWLRNPYVAFDTVMILMTTALLAEICGRRRWQFGFCLPVGKKWWLFLPAAVLAGLGGGAWSPTDQTFWPHVDAAQLVLTCILLPFAAEYLFRGTIHGFLAQRAKIQSSISGYFISWPNLGSALLYTLTIALLPTFQKGPFDLLSIQFSLKWTHASAFIFALLLGFVRERSHSIWTACLFHLVPAVLIVFMPCLIMLGSRLVEAVWPLISF